MDTENFISISEEFDRMMDGDAHDFGAPPPRWNPRFAPDAHPIDPKVAEAIADQVVRDVTAARQIAARQRAVARAIAAEKAAKAHPESMRNIK